MIDGDSSTHSMNSPLYTRMQDARWRTIYPAQFFDPIAMQSVLDPKILILWSRFFYDWHPIVHAAINGMVTYPITDFIFDTKDPKVRKDYEEAFKKLRVRETLQKIGLDYYISGTSAVSVLMPFKRMLKCPSCNYSTSVEASNAKLGSKEVRMTCPKCGAACSPIVEDTDTSDIEKMRIIHWNPLNMRIVHDEIMNDYEFYYTLPSSIKNGIIKGEKKYLESYPKYFLDAAFKNTQLKLKPSSVLHMRSPGHSAAYVKGWGQPLITPALKYLFHLLVLIRGQDALALDQILPWTIMSPAPNAGTDPADDMDLDGWSTRVREEYDKWKRDPLYKSIMPVPLNAQMVGANGKSLMLNPEIDSITGQILAGMGVPNEFVFGGLQWTGASVSLRMLENKFINYRTMMQDVIDWIVQKIHDYLGHPIINIRMQNFKMADDIAQKQLLIGLCEQKLISSKTLISEILPEIDFAEERKLVQEEAMQALKDQSELQRSQQINSIMPPGMDPNSPQPTGDPNGGGGGGGSTADKAKPLPENGPPRAQGANKQI